MKIRNGKVYRWCIRTEIIVHEKKKEYRCYGNEDYYKDKIGAESEYRERLLKIANYNHDQQEHIAIFNCEPKTVHFLYMIEKESDTRHIHVSLTMYRI